jgi:hypothetical protein
MAATYERTAVLSFPNSSRSYDAASDRIRFWGHDGTNEIPFFFQAKALLRLYPRTGATAEAILAAFDDGRVRINEIASKAYARERRRFYVLGPEHL